MIYYLSMEILSQILQAIESLDGSPSTVDLTNIRTILAESYEVVRDGLKRSNYADKYANIQKQLDSLTTEYTSLKSENQATRADVEKLQPQIKSFENLFADLKNKLVGKVQLTKSYTPEYRAVLVEQIGNATPDLFLQLKVQVESVFSHEWFDKVSPAKEFSMSGEFLDLKPFKSGR